MGARSSRAPRGPHPRRLLARPSISLPVTEWSHCWRWASRRGRKRGPRPPSPCLSPTSGEPVTPVRIAPAVEARYTGQTSGTTAAWRQYATHARPARPHPAGRHWQRWETAWAEADLEKRVFSTIIPGSTYDAIAARYGRRLSVQMFSPEGSSRSSRTTPPSGSTTSSASSIWRPCTTTPTGAPCGSKSKPGSPVQAGR
jgi:hypothetical protein